MDTPDLSKFAAIATPLDKPKQEAPKMAGGVPAIKVAVTGATRTQGEIEVPIVVFQVNSPAGMFVFHMAAENAAGLGEAVVKTVKDLLK